MTHLKKLEIGMTAPDFSLKNQNEEEVKLSDFKGKKVLLSFHPLAWTGICTDQMKSLEENYDEFKENNTIPFGISVDSVPCKKAWSDDMGLEKLQILSDFWPHGEVAHIYDNFVDRLGFSGRANILIDEDGKIKWFKVYEIKHLPEIDEVLEAIK